MRAVPFPSAWRAVIEQNLPFYARLDAADRAELEGHVQVFLAEKRFEGCGGQAITDEVRVTVAAQACVLLLHQPEPEYFPDAETILVYPHAYKVVGQERLPDGTVLEREVTRQGEAWRRGEVVLSWDDARRGAADPKDGHNLVLHEFAHKLDMEDGAVDGAPPLEQRTRYLAWARVLAPAFRDLQLAAQGGKRSVLDAYGATNPAEFFAVATECFFEKPRQLQKKHPELYERLRDYYRQDPAGLPARSKA